MISTLESLLKRIPAFYNKYLGSNPINTDIKIPAPPSAPIRTVGNAPIVKNSSNIVKLASSAAFGLDLMLANIQTEKDISYVGQAPVQISGLSGLSGLSGQPLFSGYFEDSALPGNIFNVTQLPAITAPYTIPLPQNQSVVMYALIMNDASSQQTITCENVNISPGMYQVYNWRAEVGFWEPLNISGYASIDDVLIAKNPPNAVFVPGPVFPGHESPDLDPLGDNYGVPRFSPEDDTTYRKRITESVTGKKLTPAGFIEQFRIIYGMDVGVYQWFPTSFSQLSTYLTANPGYTAYYQDGTPVSSADTVGGYYSLNPTQPQGPPTVFYVTVLQSQLSNLNNGVYPDSLGATPPDWSFFDYEDTLIGPGRHGGFFRPNIGESNYVLTSLIKRYLLLISSIESAGTYGILVVIPA